MKSKQTTAAEHFVEKRTVLFGECDPAGVLYTPRICEYIIEGAMRFVSDALGVPFERYLFARNLTLPARNLSVDFLQPVSWDDEVELRAELGKISAHALTIRVTASAPSGGVCFTGHVTQVCVDNESKKIAPMPDEFRKALQAITD